MSKKWTYIWWITWNVILIMLLPVSYFGIGLALYDYNNELSEQHIYLIIFGLILVYELFVYAVYKLLAFLKR